MVTDVMKDQVPSYLGVNQPRRTDCLNPEGKSSMIPCNTADYLQINMM